MDVNNFSQNSSLPPGENCEYQSADYTPVQPFEEMASPGPNISILENVENLVTQKFGNGILDPYTTVSDSLDKEDGMDLDLPSLSKRAAPTVPTDHDNPSSDFQHTNHIFSDSNPKEDSRPSSPNSQTSVSPIMSGSNELDPHTGDLESVVLASVPPQDSLIESVYSNTSPVTELTAKSMETTGNFPETSSQAECSPAVVSSNRDENMQPDSQEVDVTGSGIPATNHDTSQVTENSEQDVILQPDSQERGDSDLKGDSTLATNHNPDQIQLAHTEERSIIMPASSSDPSFMTAAEKTLIPHALTVEGKKLEEQQDGSNGGNSELVITNVVALDQREVFYSGNVKESARNKEMRFIKEESLVKKNSHIIKAQAAGTIREKIPDIPMMPRISRTTPQLFFAFLYLLTQRDWAKYHSDRMRNKMGFFEDLLDWFKYPSSIRHLVSKKAFLVQLQKDMISCAFQLWKDENPPLGIRDKKDGKKEPVWKIPPKLPNYDSEFSEYDDIAVPFYVWHIREDQELLALTDLVWKKTEIDEKLDAEKVAIGHDPTRLSMRTRRLLRLVATPNDLLDKIYSLRLKIDEMVIDMEANTPVDLMAPGNEEEFVNLYTYFLPKPPDEMAAIREEEREKLELEEAAIAEQNALAMEEVDTSPIAYAPTRRKKPTCSRYPVPPSMRMQMAAQKAGQEAKRPPKISQPQNSSKIKKKSKQKKKEVTWERPVRASKLRASEKLAESFAAHAQYMEQEKNGGMDGEDYTDMNGFSYQIAQHQGNDSFENATWDTFHNQNIYRLKQKSHNKQEKEEYDTPHSQELFDQEPGDLHSTQTSLPQNVYLDELHYSNPQDDDYEDQDYNDEYDDDQYDDGFAQPIIPHSSLLQTGYTNQQNHYNSGFMQPEINNQQAYSQSAFDYQQHPHVGYKQPSFYPSGQYPQSMHQPGYHVQGQYQQIQHPQDYSQQTYVPHAYSQQAYPQQVYSQQAYDQNIPIQHPHNHQAFFPQPYDQHIQSSQAYSHPQVYKQPTQSQPHAAAYDQDEHDDDYEQEDYCDEEESQSPRGYDQTKRTRPVAYNQDEMEEDYAEGDYDNQEEAYDPYNEDEEYSQTQHPETEQNIGSPQSSPLSERLYSDTPIQSLPPFHQQLNTQNPSSSSHRLNTPDLQAPNNTTHHFQPHLPFSPLDHPSSHSTPSKRLVLTYNPSKKDPSNIPFSAPPYAPKPAHAKLPTPAFPVAGIDYTAIKAKKAASKQEKARGGKRRKSSTSIMEDDLRNFVEPDDSADEDYAGPGGGGGSGKKRKRGGGGGKRKGGGRRRS